MTSGSASSRSSSTDGAKRKGRKGDNHSFDYVARTFLAGGVAGSVAKTAVAPLDRVKILFQTSNAEYRQYSGNWTGLFQAIGQIRRRDGLRGLLQGHSATLLRIFPYAAIKFVAYDQAHYFLMPTPADETNFLRFTAGAFSGTASVLITYPLEVIRVRLAFETQSASRPTLSGIIKTIYHEGYTINPARPSASTSSASSSSSTPASTSTRNPPSIFSRFPILKFYRGFAVTLLGMVPYAGTSFLVWGNLRARLIPLPSAPEPSSISSSESPSSSSPSSSETASRRDKKPPSRPIADLLIGGISGATAQTVSYPFEVVRRRMQVGGLTTPGAFQSFGQVARAIWKESGGGWRGCRGFFVGLSIGFVKIVPMTGISYATWEGMKRTLDI